MNLTDDERKSTITAIRRFFREEREEEIGDLQAALVLDFVMEAVAPRIYNQAIRDAQALMMRTVADLDVTLHEPELR